jgi:hypothetical protein
MVHLNLFVLRKIPAASFNLQTYPRPSSHTGTIIAFTAIDVTESLKAPRSPPAFDHIRKCFKDLILEVVP